MITRQQIIDIFTAIKTAVEGSIPAGGNAIGSVDVDNFPTSIEVENTAGGSVDVDVQNFPATQTVDGTVGVNNLPESIGEYQWLSTDAAPTPAAGDRVFGVEINAATHVMTVKYWTGAVWEDLA